MMAFASSNGYEGEHGRPVSMGKRLLGGASSHDFGNKRFRNSHMPFRTQDSGRGTESGMSRSLSASSMRSVQEDNSHLELEPCLPDMYHRSACLLMLAEFRRLMRTNSLDQRKAMWSLRSHAMRLTRFGNDDYLGLVLDMEASLMGLKGWEDILSPLEKIHAETYATTADEAEREEYLKAKGELVGHLLFPIKLCWSTYCYTLFMFYVAAEIESIIKPWEDSDSLPYSYSINVHGEPVTYCNDR